MTKEMIRFKYRYESAISYQCAVQMLIELYNFNSYSADQFLFAEG